jgi:hypothetical protein
VLPPLAQPGNSEPSCGPGVAQRFIIGLVLELSAVTARAKYGLRENKLCRDEATDGEVANLSRRSFLFGLTVVGIGSAIAMSVGVNAADGCGRCLEATSVAELPTVPDDAATAAVIRHGRRRPWRQLGRIGRERRAIVATTTHALLAGKVPAQSAQCCCSIGRRRIISGSAEILAMSAMRLDERAPAQETRLRSSH